jgi:hypothetical protein
VLVVVSDTHGTRSHRLDGRTRAAVREADLVAHAGDFYAEPVLDAFADVTADLVGVHGNNDDDAIRRRLPAATTFEYGGVRFGLRHGDGDTATALSLFGREAGAAVVISGHSHRPGIDADGPVTLLNPGSHAEPRRYRPAHAELVPVDADAGTGAALDGRLVTPDGDVLETFRVGSP